MAGDVRHEDSETYYLLSNRTTHGEFLFRPGGAWARTCKYILAWAAECGGPHLGPRLHRLRRPGVDARSGEVPSLKFLAVDGRRDRVAR